MNRKTALLALALGLVVYGAQGCGIDWNSLPKNHFDGVNEFGFVSIWENIGSIPLGGGLNLPLNANFRSDRTTSSSTLGSGWHLALLDANIVQIDERTFMMFDPAGPFRFFWRDSKNPNVLSGQAGWKAEIGNGGSGDTITAWADCGGVKLVFSKGRIASMQLKDKVLTYNYQNGQISEIRDGNTPILKVEKAPITGEVTGLTLANNQKIQLERGNRPRVQVVNAQQLISGVEPSLSKVTKSDGTAITFDYAVDQKLNPTLKIGNRLIRWNSATKTIISDDAWVYDIKPSEDRFANAAIGRSDATGGQKEFWYSDSKRGVETMRFADGKTKEVSRFSSGNLRGLVREVRESDDGTNKIVLRINYNEAGSALRSTLNGATVPLSFAYRLAFNSILGKHSNDTSERILADIHGNSILNTLSTEGYKKSRLLDAFGHTIKSQTGNKETIFFTCDNFDGQIVILSGKPRYIFLKDKSGLGTVNVALDRNQGISFYKALLKYQLDDSLLNKIVGYALKQQSGT